MSGAYKSQGKAMSSDAEQQSSRAAEQQSSRQQSRAADSSRAAFADSRAAESRAAELRREPHGISRRCSDIHGYLDYKKSLPLGPYSRPMPRALWSC